MSKFFPDYHKQNRTQEEHACVLPQSILNLAAALLNHCLSSYAVPALECVQGVQIGGALSIARKIVYIDQHLKIRAWLLFWAPFFCSLTSIKIHQHSGFIAYFLLYRPILSGRIWWLIPWNMVWFMVSARPQF